MSECSMLLLLLLIWYRTALIAPDAGCALTFARLGTPSARPSTRDEGRGARSKLTSHFSAAMVRLQWMIGDGVPGALCRSMPRPRVSHQQVWGGTTAFGTEICTYAEAGPTACLLLRPPARVLEAPCLYLISDRLPDGSQLACHPGFLESTAMPLAAFLPRCRLSRRPDGQRQARTCRTAAWPCWAVDRRAGSVIRRQRIAPRDPSALLVTLRFHIRHHTSSALESNPTWHAQGFDY